MISKSYTVVGIDQHDETLVWAHVHAANSPGDAIEQAQRSHDGKLTCVVFEGLLSNAAAADGVGRPDMVIGSDGNLLPPAQ